MHMSSLFFGGFARIARHRRVALTCVLAIVAVLAPLATDAATVKVAIIVGPTGYLTPMLRVQADRAATLAEQSGATVVRVYSPNATWPVVRDAIAGSSIVVYLGHGYGFPSPYRSVLTPAVHDGFGLNPAIGSGDDAHQYFGEAYVERLALAPNAVVVLSHLCYAAGNSEMGDPDAPVDVSIQRADNFAAGFIRAGAAAVIADAHMGPGYYVSQLLRGDSTIRDIWLGSPNAHGNQFAVQSVRSPGMTTQLDPDRPGAAFNRSLVTGADITAAAVRSGAQGVVATPVELAPSLTGLGITFAPPLLIGSPIAGASVGLSVPLAEGRGADLPGRLQIAARWDPLLLDEPELVQDPSALQPEPDSPDPGEPTATADPALSIPPEIEIAAPEQLGTVVEPSPADRHDHQLTAQVTVPEQTGLYRLTAILQTHDGIPFDSATNAMLIPLIVHVTGPVAVAIGAPVALTLEASATVPLPLRVANVGSEQWEMVQSDGTQHGKPGRPMVIPAQLRADWVSFDDMPVPTPLSVPLAGEGSQPGSDEIATLDLAVPTVPGDYLLVIDVWSPAFGALSAQPGRPTLIKVSVTPALGEPVVRGPAVGNAPRSNLLDP